MDKEAFEKAVLSYKDRVHSYAALMLRDRTEAQDVAQEALVRLWQNRRQVDSQATRLWLLRTTKNLCIDRIRKRKVRSEVDDGDTVMDARPDSAPGPLQLTEASELGRKIQAALAHLSAEDQTVLVMREVQGLAYDEIAETLNLPLGTLKARLHRARERLRTRLTRSGVTVGTEPA